MNESIEVITSGPIISTVDASLCTRQMIDVSTPSNSRPVSEIIQIDSSFDHIPVGVDVTEGSKHMQTEVDINTQTVSKESTSSKNIRIRTKANRVVRDKLKYK